MNTVEEPEFESVEAFVDHCIDDDRESFTTKDLTTLSFQTQTSSKKVKLQLESWGLRLEFRPPERRVRGYRTNSNDRYYGPGSCRTHGGTGWEQINGFGGQSG